MRKKLALCVLGLLLLIAAPCKAEDLSPYMCGRAVNVTEDASGIDIYIRYCIDAKAEVYAVPKTQITYAKAFERGVKEMWSGSYKGRAVNVHMQKLDESDGGSKVKVNFDVVKTPDDFPRASPWENTIWLYSGDGRDFSSVFYGYDRFIFSAGHEMGHILGLADAYSDERVNNRLCTPMNTLTVRHAQEVDYYIMLKHRTWETEGVFRYGDDECITDFITERNDFNEEFTE